MGWGPIDDLYLGIQGAPDDYIHPFGLGLTIEAEVIESAMASYMPAMAVPAMGAASRATAAVLLATMGCIAAGRTRRVAARGRA